MTRLHDSCVLRACSPRVAAPLRPLLMTYSATLSRPPLVLIVSDQEWSMRSIESILAPQGYAVLRAFTGRQALEVARSVRPDAAILDGALRDMDGIEVCRALREPTYLGVGVPIIMTSSTPEGRAERLAAYRAGAWECCNQPLDADALLAKLATFVEVKREHDRACEESMIDQLTGLYSVRGLSRRAREIAAEAQRQRQPLACVALAPAASTAKYDEQETERVVRIVGSVLRDSGRISDAIGRMGQTEFGIVAPATDAAGATRLVERLQASLDAAPANTADAGVERPRLLAGYAAVPDFSTSPTDVADLLLRATSALRHVISDGRGRRSGPSLAAFDALPAR